MISSLVNGGKLMYIKIKPVIIVVLFLLLSLDLEAGSFDKFGAGARPISLGKSYIGYAEGVETIFWNPAGMISAKAPQLSATYADLYSLDLLNYWILGVVYPNIAYGTIGLGITSLGTTSHPSLAGLDHSQKSVYLSYAYQIGPLVNIGLNCKTLFVRSAKQAMGFGFDVGLLFLFSKYFRMGVTITDITDTKIKWSKEAGVPGPAEETITRELGTGIYFHPIKYALLVADYTGLLNDEESLHMGLEIRPIKYIGLRGGIFQQSKEYNYTIGFGLFWKNWRIDYSFFSHFDLDPTSIFSVHYQFGDLNSLSSENKTENK